MSTRCQVQIKNKEDKVTLYHHSDGYPDWMVNVFYDASAYRNTIADYASFKFTRSGYVAGVLCIVDPLQFELLDYHDLHGDIEYYYILDVSDMEWILSIYETNLPDKKRIYHGPINKAFVEWNKTNLVKRALELQKRRKK